MVKLFSFIKKLFNTENKENKDYKLREQKLLENISKRLNKKRKIK
jgi:hypothetical protein